MRSDHWHTFRTTLHNLLRALGLVWNAHRLAMLSMMLVSLLSAVLPVLQAWVGKLIVDTVVAGMKHAMLPDLAFQAVLPYVLLEFGLITLGAMLNEGRGLLHRILGNRLMHTINLAIIRNSLALDMSFFEDAAFYDKLQNARNEASWRSLEMVDNSFSLVQEVITLSSLLVLLLAFSPLVTLILLCATLPAFIARIHNSNEFYRFRLNHTPEARRMDYLEHLLTTDQTIKEVKLFNLGEPLLKRYRDIFKQYYREDIRLAHKRAMTSSFWGLLSTFSAYGAYTVVIWRTVQSAITLGDMTLYLALCQQAQGTFQKLFIGVSQLYEGGLFLENLFGFLDLRPRPKIDVQSHARLCDILQGVEFRNVSFRYPGSEDWALRNINLHIAHGEKLALVGANGAGKTTLAKLLTRLYDPTEGQLLLDGIDVREYDQNQLRERISVVFQDYVRYQMTARENIGFGQIDQLDDDQRISAAAQRGGADEIITTLPEGYETMLGHWFEKGHELSGGQWQKIALSRAFMRESDVLVLDEPTASLDAEHEYELFQRFRDLAQGRIAILISHRFSTVRMADRIAVVEGGQLTELGTHHELLIRDGTYARLFNLQADGYR